MNRFLITPSRRCTGPAENDCIDEAVARLPAMTERKHDAYIGDYRGDKALLANVEALRSADEVYVWYSPDDYDALIDIGAAIALRKKIMIVNKEKVRQLSQRDRTAKALLAAIGEN